MKHEPFVNKKVKEKKKHEPFIKPFVRKKHEKLQKKKKKHEPFIVPGEHTLIIISILYDY